MIELFCRYFTEVQALMDALGRYSYVIACLILLVGAALAGVQLVSPPALVVGEAALLGVFVIFWVFGRRGEAYAHPDKVLKKLVGNGRPLVVHFYSDASLPSLLQKLRFGRRERRWSGRVQIVCLNINLSGAQDIAAQLEADLGDFILFDAAGHERVRTRMPAEADLQALFAVPAR